MFGGVAVRRDGPCTDSGASERMWPFLSRVRGVALRWPRLKGQTKRRELLSQILLQGRKPQTALEKDTWRSEGQEAASRRWLTVSVEGNIGSGKSTFIQHFGKLGEVEAVSEPVEKWRNLHGHNLFKLMYDNPVRWSHTFQTYVQLTMAQSHLQPCTAPVKLMERSIHSARYIFVENMYQSGVMSEAEYHVYNEWYKAILGYVDCGVDLIVYLRTNPELVHARIKDRARDEEQQIPLEYIKALHSSYENWIFEEKYPLLAPVLVIDANDELSTMYKKYKHYTNMILRRKAMLNLLAY